MITFTGNKTLDNNTRDEIFFVYFCKFLFDVFQNKYILFYTIIDINNYD